MKEADLKVVAEMQLARFTQKTHELRMTEMHLTVLGLLEQTDVSQVPACLKTEEAEELMEELSRAGLLSEDWQPRVSRPEAALMANMLSEKLGIAHKWKVFEQFWSRNNMRSDYNTALEQRKSLEFQEKLKKVLF